MTIKFPAPGQVFEYHYLWKWQHDSGETEGRKSRPCCVSVVIKTKADQTLIFIAAITSQDPGKGRTAIRVPEIEAHRAGLDRTIPLWVMLDELNVDILERSHTLEDRTPRGSFSGVFTRKIVTGIQSLRQRHRLNLTNRTD